MPIKQLKNKIDRFDQVEIKVDYSKGGINYFTYKNEDRGYYMYFTPCNCTQDKFGLMKEYEFFHKRSFKILIEKANRLSKKRLDMLQKLLELNIDDIIKAYEIDNDMAAKKVYEVYGVI